MKHTFIFDQNTHRASEIEWEKLRENKECFASKMMFIHDSAINLWLDLMMYGNTKESEEKTTNSFIKLHEMFRSREIYMFVRVFTWDNVHSVMFVCVCVCLSENQ